MKTDILKPRANVRNIVGQELPTFDKWSDFKPLENGLNIVGQLLPTLEVAGQQC